MTNNTQVCEALEKFLKANEEELKKPETWEQNKALVLFIMGFIPAALPYTGIVNMIFDIIINAIKSQQQ